MDLLPCSELIQAILPASCMKKYCLLPQKQNTFLKALSSNLACVHYRELSLDVKLPTPPNTLESANHQSHWTPTHPRASMEPEWHPYFLWTYEASRLGRKEQPWTGKLCLKQTWGSPFVFRPTLLLESDLPADFRSNPVPTHLPVMFK